MIKNQLHRSKKLWATIAVGASLFLRVEQLGLAAYKIHLKSGKVIEAKSKPVSMEGKLHFTTVDGSFQSLPIGQVDLEGTDKLNTSLPGRQPVTKVLTNDDLSLKGGEHHNAGDLLTARERESPGTVKPTSKGLAPSKEQKRGESYWRAQAKQIKDQMAAVDNEIRKLDEKRESGQSDGVRIGYGTTTQYLLANFEDQRKKLEKSRQDLEQQMRALEEEARQAGAMPGWLR